MTRIGFVVAAVLAFAAGSFLQWNIAPPAWAVVAPMRVAVETTAKPLTAVEAKKIEAYMRHVFGSQSLRLVHMPPDAEVYLGENFLGVVFPEDSKEGRTFYFEMSIFDDEVEESPPARRGR